MSASDRRLKRRRKRWVDMLTQLRYASKVAPDVAPGNCQDMLDWLIAREWPFASEPPRPSYITHHLHRLTDTAENLVAAMPAWAQGIEREPHSMDGLPIFYKTQGRLIYLDGRRRLNALFREDPHQNVDYWVIE